MQIDIKNYLENQDEIDYWQIIKQHPLSIEGIDFSKNEPFTTEEQNQLQVGIEEIKLLVKANLDLKDEQIEIVNSRLDYLIKATDRLNKTDWKGVAISMLAALAYDLALDDTKRTTFFGLFSKLWAIIQHLPTNIL